MEAGSEESAESDLGMCTNIHSACFLHGVCRLFVQGCRCCGEGGGWYRDLIRDRQVLTQTVVFQSCIHIHAVIAHISYRIG